jgi:hypothetical protein
LHEEIGIEEQEISQKNIYVHPRYDEKNKPSRLYDIALVKLDERIERKPDLLPVCLWDKTIESIP